MRTLHLWTCMGRCPEKFQRRIGFDVFHGHIAALVIASGYNKDAGRKVKRIKVEDAHFVIVDA